MRIIFAGFIFAALCLPSANQVSAHSFNVALAIPTTGQSELISEQILDGFMMATQERDSHPDNEADGHLGGLDVYVYPADNQYEVLTRLRTILNESTIDIIVSIGTDDKVNNTIAGIIGTETILLTPGRLPYPTTAKADASQRPAQLVSFITAFQIRYGYEPTELSAHGYNAARRIDAAIRPLDSVDDKIELSKRLAQTASKFSW